jgi:hypothetical protein
VAYPGFFLRGQWWGVWFTNSVEDRGHIERGGVLLNFQMGKTHILIRLLRMYFPWNWEYEKRRTLLL